jgi:hypothetical protein
MIKALMLALFGWKRTPEWFVRRCADYIPLCLKTREGIPADQLPAACRLALAQLAYLRAVNMDSGQRPRFRDYVFELERTASAIADALRKGEAVDDRMRSILLFYKVI